MDEASAGNLLQRSANNRLHAPAVDLGHREHRDAVPPDQGPLAVVEAPTPDEHGSCALDRGKRPGVALEAAPREPERSRERHPVNVAARGRLGRVEIPVGVEPEDGAGPVHGSEPAECPERHRVIPAEHERKPALAGRSGNQPGQLLAGRSDRVQVVRTRVAGADRLSDRGGYVPAVAATVPERLDPLGQPCVADRRRAHVHAAAPGRSEIERHSDHSDVARPHAGTLRRLPAR